ncbi:tyrosine-protein phosphatase [Paenibacillus yanchengensis]|uniref:Tyrosine-protein phosphatase n=1 Tax=Paenibacillus yanchengensis TaxID=2035833 RepID=A0ABW4YI30_9BACL
MTVNILPFEGVYNFRDMGGYKTKDCRTVKYGRLYRSAELTGMTIADRRLFKTLGIKTIFDYRSDDEAASKPDPCFSGVTNIRIPAMTGVSMDLGELILSGEFENITPEIFAEMYVEMAFNNPSFKKLMELFADGNNAGLLHHCTAGRDRTGIGSAFIYLALGVCRETIIEDYLISNITLEPMFEQWREQLEGILPEEKIENLLDVLRLRPMYLNAIFNVIDEVYCSTAAFLEEEFGLTQAKLEQIRQFYLE